MKRQKVLNEIKSSIQVFVIIIQLLFLRMFRQVHRRVFIDIINSILMHQIATLLFLTNVSFAPDVSSDVAENEECAKRVTSHCFCAKIVCVKRNREVKQKIRVVLYDLINTQIRRKVGYDVK